MPDALQAPKDHQPMRSILLLLVLTFSVLPTQAQNAESSGFDLTAEQIDRMADSFGRAIVEGRVWARIMTPLEELYRERRGKGDTSKQALYKLRRLALPGADVGELGQRGQLIRRTLEALSRYAQRVDGLGEPAAVAATALALHDVLQTLIAIEKPSHIHLAVADQDGIAKLRRSEILYDGKTLRTVFKFTEDIGGAFRQECTINTLGLTEDVYFDITCQTRGKDASPRVVAKSQCSIHNDRFRSLRLVPQTKDAEPGAEALVWCSFEPR